MSRKSNDCTSWKYAFIFTAMFGAAGVAQIAVQGFAPASLILPVLAVYTAYIGLRARNQQKSF